MNHRDEPMTVDTSVTRRRVVATGTKLLYAAPLVAASFRLNRLGVSAQDAVGSPPEFCQASTVCLEIIHDCGPVASPEACQCLRSTGGDVRCGADFVCGETRDCTTSSECEDLGPGYFCEAPGTGCCADGVGVCVPPCGGATVAVSAGELQADRRTNRDG